MLLPGPSVARKVGVRSEEQKAELPSPTHLFPLPLPAALPILDPRICRSALTKNILPCRFTTDASSRPFGGEKSWGIKIPVCHAIHGNCLLLHAFRLPTRKGV